AELALALLLATLAAGGTALPAATGTLQGANGGSARPSWPLPTVARGDDEGWAAVLGGGAG
ncbi:MAG: hypothetical protein ACKPKO_06225, partial [Candidatus Fonsibacter sp.]